MEKEFKGEPIQMTIIDQKMALYPQCQICMKNLGKRSCSIAIEKDGDPIYRVVCSTCYTLYMRLQQFQDAGLIVREDLR